MIVKLLAIIKAFKGNGDTISKESPTLFEILSDHKKPRSLPCVQTVVSPSRWAEFLSRFSFTIQHISGKKSWQNQMLLSRRPDHIPDHEDNEDRIPSPV